MDGAIGLQTGVGENDNQTLGLLIIGRNWNMLFSDQLRKFRRRAGLSPWRTEVSVRHGGGYRGVKVVEWNEWKNEGGEKRLPNEGDLLARFLFPAT